MNRIVLLISITFLTSGCTLAMNDSRKDKLCFSKAREFNAEAFSFRMDYKDVLKENSKYNYAFSKTKDQELDSLVQKIGGVEFNDDGLDSKSKRNDIYLKAVDKYKKLFPDFHNDCVKVYDEIKKACMFTFSLKSCLDSNENRFEKIKKKHLMFSKFEAKVKDLKVQLDTAIKNKDLDSFLKSIEDFSALLNEEGFLAFYVRTFYSIIQKGEFKLINALIDRDKTKYSKDLLFALITSEETDWSKNKLEAFNLIKPNIKTDVVNQLVAVDFAELIVKNKRFSLLEALLQLGLDTSRRNKHAENLIVYAVNNDHNEAVKLMIKSGVSKHTRDRFNRSLLHIAVENHNIELVKYFLNIGLNKHRKEYGDSGKTALEEAKLNSSTEMTNVLSE